MTIYFFKQNYPFLVFFFLINLFASKGVTQTQYESHLKKPNSTEHFYLTDQVENNRRVFFLFHAKNQQLQDLIQRKSFSTLDQKLSDHWLQKTLKKYQLQKQKISEKPQFYPFSQVQYYEPQSHHSLNSSESSSSQEQDHSHALDTAKLWEATNEWSPQWEIEYGRWVNNNLTAHFMMDINLPSDCADVAYTLRWIFAYINKLPMAVRLGGSGQLFTNETMKPEWLNLPTNTDWKKDRRFFAALQFILNNTYTHTLMDESYPLAINPEILTSGAYHLALHESTGHTMIVHKINESNNLPITLLFSTMPIKIRELYASFYQETQVPQPYKAGFYKIRWAKKTASGWQIISAKSIPGYSEEQFHLAPESTPHFINVFKQLNPQFSFETMLNNGFDELQKRLQERVQIVEEGFKYCQTHDCSPGSPGDEDWSTPSRDKRLLQLHSSVNMAAFFLMQADPAAALQAKEAIAKKVKEIQLVIENKNYSFSQIITALIYKLIQTDPTLSIAQRWNVAPTEGYGPTLIKLMQSKFSERKTLVDQSEECRQKPCDEKSKAFQSFNTFWTDNTILSWWTAAQTLCHLSTENDCETLKNLLQSQSLENQTYFDLYTKSAAWNSNPNTQPQQRWGDHGTTLYFNNELPGLKAAYFTKDLQWFTMNQNLVKRANFTQIDMPKNEILGQLHFESNQYFTYQRTDSKLILRFYTVPQIFISEIILNENATAPLRLWWSSPTKKTLSVFSGTHFYELDPATNSILQELKINKFRELPLDPRITLIETDQGVLMSDAQKDASQFIPFPLPLDKIKNIYDIQKSSLGWGFRTLDQFIYVEAQSKFIIQWPCDYNYYIFVQPQGHFFIKSNSEKALVEVYKRESSPNTSDPQLVLVKTIQALYTLGANDSYFSAGSEKTSTTYAFDTLAPVKLPCFTENTVLFILNNDYYYCFNSKTKGLHHISGKSLLTTNNNIFWGLSGSSLGFNSSHQWFSMYKNTSISVSPNTSRTLSYSEFYSLTPESLTGPILQIMDEDYESQRFAFTSSVGNPPVDPLQAGVAPPPLSINDKTNYGLSKLLPFYHSFILNISLETYKNKQILFVPNL